MDIPKSQLNISHLKMICTIERCQSVKEAAERLFITQPALSNRIREAEKRLQTKLFVRRGRKLIITTAGKRLLHSATKILEELARAEYDIARLSDGVEQVLRLGLPHYASFKWLPSVIHHFDEHFPNVELELTSDTARQPLNALLNGDVDIALFSSKEPTLVLNDPGFQTEPLFEDELVACLSKQHQKAGSKFLLPEDFRDENYITNSTVPEKDREYELFFKPENILPQKVIQAGFNEAIIELLKVNIGMSVFSKHLIEPYLESNNLTTARLGESGLNVYWHIVWLNSEGINAPAKALIKLIQKGR